VRAPHGDSCPPYMEGGGRVKPAPRTLYGGPGREPSGIVYTLAGTARGPITRAGTALIVYTLAGTARGFGGCPIHGIRLQRRICPRLFTDHLLSFVRLPQPWLGPSLCLPSGTNQYAYCGSSCPPSFPGVPGSPTQHAPSVNPDLWICPPSFTAR
jgi:hypothetical protein